MRILMLTDFYPPIIGGVEQHVRNLGAELAARGHSVAVVTLLHEGLAPFEVDRMVRVYRVASSTGRLTGLFSEPGRRYAPPFPDPEVTWAMRAVIAREQPEVVHAHNWLVHSFLPLRRWSGARLVVSLHDYSMVCAKKSLMYEGALCSGPALAKCMRCASSHYGMAKGMPTVAATWAMTQVERRAVDMFLPVSEAVAHGNRLVQDGVPFQVVPNFIPDDVGTAPDTEEPLPTALPERPYLLFVGALGRHKGVDVLLESYAGIADAPPLVLIGAPWGDTPTVFPPNVTVLQNWPHHAVMRAWRGAMVALAPSVWPEPCPTVVMEAMASGVPVIASRIGGLPDLVDHERSGLLVAPGDRAALRGAIERLLADHALREHMGQAGARKVASFRASTVIARIEQVYTDVSARQVSESHRARRTS